MMDCNDRNSPEVGSNSSALLESLSEHLVLADVVVGHRTPGELHCLLEVVPPDLGHGIVIVFLETN